MNTQELLSPIFQHRSIRKYKNQAISEEVLHLLLEAGSRASTTGNMQLYSIIVTQDTEQKKALAPLHFNQAMISEAPLVLTFAADIHRFHQWCEINKAGKVYDNFAWFLNGMTDTLLSAQNVAIAAEAQGLGICYLGTTIYMAKEIAEFFKFPEGVIPITTLTIGYPAEEPELAPRLALEAVVHREQYHNYKEEEIRNFFASKENTEETKKLLQVNDLPNLAQIFTLKRYPQKDNIEFSKRYLRFLQENGFMNQ
ncbi:MAG: nitroreductase family protein [Bacteroidales bacterium]